MSATKSDHSIIYSGSKAPEPSRDERPQEGEAPMMDPIRVKPKSRPDRLDPMSRINYMKIYSLEHNVKVFEFGDVAEESMSRLKKNFATVWNATEDTDENLAALAYRSNRPNYPQTDDSDEDSHLGMSHRDMKLPDSHSESYPEDTDDPDDESAEVDAELQSKINDHLRSLERSGQKQLADWIRKSPFEQQVNYLEETGEI
jgi:hypothetical protein